MTRTSAPPPLSHATARGCFAQLDPDACYRALAARDARFDGVFFVGVRTTGVYCRPVCSARTPGRDRCDFFPRAVLAEQAGFRACFRCRPERAPGEASIDAVSRLVGAALRRIEEGALNDSGVAELARSLGVSDRHLRRAMQGELGVGPLEVALSRRIAIARELLMGTTTPITEIAMAAGFGSLRRFNAAFQAHQGMTPSAVRRPSSRAASTGTLLPSLRLVLDVRKPFDADAAFAFLRARQIVGHEAFVGATYEKAVVLRSSSRGAKPARGIVAIEADRARCALVVRASTGLASALPAIAARVRRMFDTNADLSAIAAHLGTDPLLAERVAARPALRVMGAFDPFEWATRAVLGQQISVRAALTIGARLVERFGEEVATAGAAEEFAGAPTRAWPSPAVLAAASVDALSSIGLTKARAQTLRGLAAAIDEGTLRLDGEEDPAVTRARLLALPGVGPWTADYIAMRALAWPDAFPAGDLALRKAVGGAELSAKECERRAEVWRPWRAYAAAHLWTGSAEETGT